MSSHLLTLRPKSISDLQTTRSTRGLFAEPKCIPVYLLMTFALCNGRWVMPRVWVKGRIPQKGVALPSFFKLRQLKTCLS